MICCKQLYQTSISLYGGQSVYSVVVFEFCGPGVSTFGTWRWRIRLRSLETGDSRKRRAIPTNHSIAPPFWELLSQEYKMLIRPS